MKAIISLTLLITCMILITSCNYSIQDSNSIVTNQINGNQNIPVLTSIGEETTESSANIEINSYNENDISYKSAQALLKEYSNAEQKKPANTLWKKIIDNGIDYYPYNNMQTYSVAEALLIDLNSDGYFEVIFKEFIPGNIMDTYYSIYSLQFNKLLVNIYIRGDCNIYKKNNNYVIKFSNTFSHNGFHYFFEITDDSYAYDNIYDDLWIGYLDKNIKMTAFHADYSNIENKCFSKIENMETIFLKSDEELFEALENYTNSMVLCTDEFKSISIMNTDFKNFDTLVEALKPLDNYMEKDSENQTGNSDAK